MSDKLDVAWKEVERELPCDPGVSGVLSLSVYWAPGKGYGPPKYKASFPIFDWGIAKRPATEATGDSPVEALHRLAELLRAMPAKTAAGDP